MLRFSIRIRTEESRARPSTLHPSNLLQQLPHPLLETMLHTPRALHHLHELLYTASRGLDPVELRERVEPVRNVRHERALIRLRNIAHVLHVQECRNPNLLRRNAEGECCVALVVGFVEGVVVDQVWSVDIEQGAEREAVVP